MKKRLSVLALALVGVTGLVAFGMPDAHADATPPLRIMPLGDSITYGLGSSTTSSYRADLWNKLTATGAQLDFVGSAHSGALPDADNEGHSGWRIDQIADIAPCAVAKSRPNLVTLHLGTNDMGQDYQTGTAPQRLGALIDQLLAADPGVTVLVASLVPSNDAAEQARTVTFNQQLPGLVGQQQAAGKHVRLGRHVRGHHLGSQRPVAPERQRLPQDGHGIRRRSAGLDRRGLDQQPGRAGDRLRPRCHPQRGVRSVSRRRRRCAALGLQRRRQPAVLDDGRRGDPVRRPVPRRRLGSRHRAALGLQRRNQSEVDGRPRRRHRRGLNPADAWMPERGSSCGTATAARIRGGCPASPGSCAVRSPGAARTSRAAVRRPARNLSCGTATALSTRPGRRPRTGCSPSTTTAAWDVSGGGTTDGTPVVIWSCNGGANQLWAVRADGSVVSAATGKCLDAAFDGTANSTALVLWTCTGGANQKWNRS